MKALGIGGAGGGSGDAHGIPWGARIAFEPGDVAERLASALEASRGMGRILYSCATRGDAGVGVEVTLYLEGPASSSGEALRDRLRSIPGAGAVDIWGGEGDPVLAAAASGVEVAPIPSPALAEMFDALGAILGPEGAALSYHMALRLGRRLMGMLSAVREPRGVEDALSYAREVLHRYGLGEMRYEVLPEGEEPIHIHVVVKPGPGGAGFTDAAAGMVRGLVAGMLSRAVGRELAVSGRHVEGEGEDGSEVFELVEARG